MMCRVPGLGSRIEGLVFRYKPASLVVSVIVTALMARTCSLSMLNCSCLWGGDASEDLYIYSIYI